MSLSISNSGGGGFEGRLQQLQALQERNQARLANAATDEHRTADARVEVGDTDARTSDARGFDVSDRDTLTARDDAQQLESNERAQLGALDDTLARQQNRLATARESADAARARIEDLDYARAVAETTRERILTDLTATGQRVSEQDRARVLDLLV